MCNFKCSEHVVYAVVFVFMQNVNTQKLCLDTLNLLQKIVGEKLEKRYKSVTKYSTFVFSEEG